MAAKITSVKVWGFQSWVNAQYDLHPGLNVFTGPSGSGKTAGTIRAIRWVVKGEPSGDSFLHTVYGPDGKTVVRQASEAGVEIKLDDGTTITKIRKGAKTKYWITPMYEEPFEKAEVPEAVKEALGIRTSEFGDFETDLNFAYQLSAPFLLSEPGSAGAKVLGKLAGTEAVDGAIKSTAKDTYAARNEKQAADKEYERKVEQLTAYEGLDALQEQLDACDFLLNQVTDTCALKDVIEVTMVMYEAASRKLQAAADVLDKLTDLPKLETDLLDIEKAQQQLDHLKELYQQWERATATVEDLTQKLGLLTGLESIEWLLSEVDKADQERQSLVSYVADYTRYTEAVNKSNLVLESVKNLDVASDLLNKVTERTNSLEILRNYVTAYELQTFNVGRYTSILKSLTKVNEAEALVLQAEKDLQELTKLKEIMHLYRIKSDTVKSADLLVASAGVELKAAEKELSAAWEAAGGKCPLCEQAVAHTH